MPWLIVGGLALALFLMHKAGPASPVALPPGHPAVGSLSDPVVQAAHKALSVEIQASRLDAFAHTLLTPQPGDPLIYAQLASGMQAKAQAIRMGMMPGLP